METRKTQRGPLLSWDPKTPWMVRRMPEEDVVGRVHGCQLLWSPAQQHTRADCPLGPGQACELRLSGGSTPSTSTSSTASQGVALGIRSGVRTVTPKRQPSHLNLYHFLVLSFGTRPGVHNVTPRRQCPPPLLPLLPWGQSWRASNARSRHSRGVAEPCSQPLPRTDWKIPQSWGWAASASGWAVSPRSPSRAGQGMGI